METGENLRPAHPRERQTRPETVLRFSDHLSRSTIPAATRGGRPGTSRGLSAAVIALALSGCVVAQPGIVKHPPTPPPARVEIAPVAPTLAHVWVPGHWAWYRAHYVWLPGHWEVPASPGYVWVPGGWMPRGGGYVWVEGHWRAR